jgi:LysM repeat protein
MKLPKLLVRKKLRATTARRSLAVPEMEYEEMSEPNMKLSRALLIVLVLHVVAVAGIIAFNTIKSRQGAFPPPKVTAAPAVTQAVPAPPPKAETVVASTSNQTTASPATKPVAKDEGKIPKALPVGNESGNFYIVAKGDNPVKIAKKLKVSESDLLAANHIDDPRKLQIGQKLIVPAKAKAKKGGG